MKNKIILSLIFLFSVSIGFSQSKTVTGVIKNELGETIPGAIIRVKDSQVKTKTDLNGMFSITVPSEDAILMVSSLGMDDKQIPIIGQNNINIVLTEGKMLDEVVITALGIKREEKALGYAVTQISGDAIRESNQTNIVNALSGAVAGANVTQSSGTAGGGSRVVLRGFTSLDGNNEALFVIDGVKIINNELNRLNESTRGVSQSNRGIDLNPDDIESISVLKGGAATALYGIDGANGVIIITTKKGEVTKGTGKKLNVSVGYSLGFAQVNRLPELQNNYSQGTAWYSGDGITPEYYAPETGWLTSWGPAYSDLSWTGESGYDYDKNGQIVLNSDPSAAKAVSPYSNVDDFFRTGVTGKANISISGGSEIATFRLSVSDVREAGIVPNNTFSKTNIGLVSAMSFLEDKLKVTTSANYINSGGQRVQQGSNLSGVMLGLLRTPITFDNSNGNTDPVNDVTSYELVDGSQRNFRGGGGYDNPWWTVNKNPYTDKVNRLLGNFQSSYNFSKLLTISVNIGLDTYSDRRQQIFAIGSRAQPGGQIVEEIYTVLQTDAYLLFSGSSYLDKAKNFDINYQAGFNAFSYNENNLYSQGDNFAFIGFPQMSNASDVLVDRSLIRNKSLSTFASVDFGYKRFLYVTLTGRQDYDSRFLVPEQEFKSKDIGFFYPSISGSFVFSKLMNLSNKSAFSFGKLRMSWARVAKGPPVAYATSTTYGSAIIDDGWTLGNGINFPYNGVSYFLGNTAGNPTLVPEESNEFEIGTALNFYKRRLQFDVAYYNRKSINVIVPVTVSGATGFRNIYLNSGVISTNGVDISIKGVPIQQKSFEWSIGANFTKYKSVVDELAPGLEQMFIGGFTSTGIYHIPGEEFGQIYGGQFLRDNGGNMVIDDDPTSVTYGYPLADPELAIIGNPNPDFLLGITNNFKIKNFSVSLLFDMKVGGEMWNGTQGALTFFGMSKLTEDRDQPGEGGTTVFEGVAGHLDDDGNVVVTGSNTVEVGLNEDWYTGNGGGFGSVAENFVQDASSYRLRNAAIRYQIPKEKLKGHYLKNVVFSVSGNNLLLFTPYEGIDPETSLLGSSSNGQGIDYFNMPNTRSVTFGVNVKF